MKKAAIIMISITAAFLCGMLGIFLGRMGNDGTILVHTGSSIRSETQNQEETIGSMLININTANSEQLQELPGIGESMAEEIIAYRRKNGPFKRKRELMNVKGIGEKTYEELKDMITTDD